MPMRMGVGELSSSRHPIAERLPPSLTSFAPEIAARRQRRQPLKVI